MAISRTAFNLSSTCSFQIAIGGDLAPTGWFCSTCSLVKPTPLFKETAVHFTVTQFLVPENKSEENSVITGLSLGQERGMG